MFDKAIETMAGLRFFSSFLEVTAAITILFFNDIRTALRINAALGLVGPIILIIVTAIGLYSAADELSTGRIFMILGGVGLIILGTR